MTYYRDDDEYEREQATTDRGVEQMSHTPGPWTVASRGDKADGFILRDADGEFISYLDDSRYCDGRIDPTAEANARLIAAAPDLLAALRWIMERTDAQLSLNSACRIKARAAIAKAEGKE